MTADRRQALALERRNMAILRQFSEDGVLPNAQRPRGMSRITGTSSFRRRTYAKDLWVQPLSDITGRYRETTPEFFQLNPAMTHRLVPWLNRELNVLLTNQDHRSYVLDMIIRLITQHHILSRHFRDALQQYTAENTEHFIHEFYQFARSPYDMYGFDENAQYDRRERQFNFEEVAVESSESSDDEVSTRFTAIRSRSRRVVT
jgi:E3 ubiquitin-protein ligase Topors